MIDHADDSAEKLKADLEALLVRADELELHMVGALISTVIDVMPNAEA